MTKTKSNTSSIELNSYLFSLVYIVFALLFEVVQFSWLGFGILPKYFLFDFAIMIVIASIIFILPGNAAKNSVMYFFLGLQFVLNIANITLYNVFGDIMSFDMLLLGAEAATAFSFSFIDFLNLFTNFALMALAIVAGVMVTKNVVGVRRVNKFFKTSILLIVFMLGQTFGYSFYSVSLGLLKDANPSSPTYIMESDVYLQSNLFLKLESYKKFGTFGFYFKSLVNIIFNPNSLEKHEQKVLNDKITEGEGYKFVSDKSGALEDNNVVMILMESFDWYAINPVYTPTLYALANGTYAGPDGTWQPGGYSFDNFYGRNKTNVSEGISFLGNMPRTEMLVMYERAVGLSAPYSLPNLVRADAEAKGETFKSTYLHTYLSSFYARNTTYDKLGFDEILCVDNVYDKNPIKVFNDWIFDEQFIKDTIDNFLPTDVDRFYTQFASMSTHGSYQYNTQEVYLHYIDEVEDKFDEYTDYLHTQTTFTVPESEYLVKALKHYITGAIDFDKAIAYLIQEMDNRGLADNTTLVLYADHNSYYDDLSVQLKDLNKDEYYEIEAYRIPFIIYNKNFDAGVDSTFCSTYDIYPTVCDLLDLPVNRTITQGNSIFSDEIENSIFVSFLNGIFDDELYSVNISDIIKLTDREVAKEEIEAFQNKAIDFYLKQDIVEKVWKNNIFSKRT